MTLFVTRPEADPVHLARTMAESLIRQAAGAPRAFAQAVIDADRL